MKYNYILIIHLKNIYYSEKLWGIYGPTESNFP